VGEKDLATLLRSARERRGESLRGAARGLGVDASYLSRVESGGRRPSEEFRERASHYYDLDNDAATLAAGSVPPDIAEILREHPDLIDKLRRDYGHAG